MTFDYGLPAELFMGRRKGVLASGWAIVVLPRLRRPSVSRSKISLQSARLARGCRSETLASTATTYDACTTAMVIPCAVARTNRHKFSARQSHNSRGPRRSSIMRLASATISSVLLFSRLTGLFGHGEVEPGEKMDALHPFPKGRTSIRYPLYSMTVMLFARRVFPTFSAVLFLRQFSPLASALWEIADRCTACNRSVRQISQQYGFRGR
jgi:hypothetical protein